MVVPGAEAREVGDAVSQDGRPATEKANARLAGQSVHWNDDGENGPSCFADEEMSVCGDTCSMGAAGGLTARLAVRVVLPLPFVVLVNEMVPVYVLGLSASALALTVKVMVVP